MMKPGFLVVHMHGKDNTIYTIEDIDTINEVATIKTFTKQNSKKISLSSIREALDEEVLIGFRLNTKGS